MVFASLPGMTVEWLQRVVDRHRARNTVMSDADKMPYCPLAVPYVKAQVLSVGNASREAARGRVRAVRDNRAALLLSKRGRGDDRSVRGVVDQRNRERLPGRSSS